MKVIYPFYILVDMSSTLLKLDIASDGQLFRFLNTYNIPGPTIPTTAVGYKDYSLSGHHV